MVSLIDITCCVEVNGEQELFPRAHCATIDMVAKGMSEVNNVRYKYKATLPAGLHSQMKHLKALVTMMMQDDTKGGELADLSTADLLPLLNSGYELGVPTRVTDALTKEISNRLVREKEKVGVDDKDNDSVAMWSNRHLFPELKRQLFATS